MALDHLALLADDLDRFAVAIETGPADAPIAGCPGWDLRRLGLHLAGVHRWVLAALELGTAPRPDQLPSDPEGDQAAVAAYVREGSARLLAALAEVDPAAPTWHPFPVEPKVAGLWRRRQAQEASVHRWDAERAAGGTPTIEAEFAADGIDEYWTVMLPRMLLREQRTSPATRVAVLTTDTAQRWAVDGSTGLPVVLDSGAHAAATISGPADAVLLTLWGRPASGVTVDGDAEVAAGWLDLGGA